MARRERSTQDETVTTSGPHVVTAKIVELTSEPGVPRAVNDPPAPAVPQNLSRVGRYVLIELLGKGGMGVVYAGYDPELDRRVAIKILLSRRTHVAEDRARMLREARALARLSHPNVVPIFDVGVHEGIVFIAMELVRGVTLRTWLRAEPRPWRQVLDVFIQAGRGLESAHRKRMIHRDFKPANVMVRESGEAVVMDFGLARLYEDEHGDFSTHAQEAETSQVWEARLTRAGCVMGTPAYMAPEQHEAQPADPRSDQFSFCVALYEGLYGVRPFIGSTPAELREAIYATRVAPPDRTEVPRWVFDVVARGLAIQPDDRWPSMHDLLQALEADPSRRRRARRIGLGAITLSGVLVGGVAVDRRHKHATCEQRADRIDGTWGAERRAALVEALDAVGSGHRRETYARLLPALDRYAEHWGAAARGACEGELLEGDWSDERVRGAAACLDEAHAAFATFIDLVDGLDVDTSPHAVEALLDLPAPESCVDPDLPRRLLPSAPTGQAAEDRGRALAGARVRVAAGQARQALEIAQRVRRSASGADPATATRALEVVGRAQERLGKTHEAVTAFERVVREASNLGDDRAVARAASHLVWLEGFSLGHAKVGATWAATTEVAAAHLPAQDSGGKLLVAEARRDAAFVRGDYERALDEAMRVHDILVESLGPEHPKVARSLRPIGLCRQYLGDLEGAREAFEEALAGLEASLGEHHPAVAAAVADLGVYHLEHGDRTKARPLLRQALRISEATNGPDHPSTGNIMERLARERFYAKDYAAALEHYRRALAIAEKTAGNELSVAQILNNLGNVHDARGEWERSVEVYTRAEKIQRAAQGEGHVERLVSVLNLGDAYVHLGDRERGFELLDEAVRLRARAPEDAVPGLAVFVEVRADALLREHRWAEAVAAFEELLALRSTANAPPKDLARIRARLAEAREGLTADAAFSAPTDVR